MYIFFQFISLTIKAQEEESLMRSSGKIYVVVSILVTIFLGIVFYLIMVDKKISRLEELKKREGQEN